MNEPKTPTPVSSMRLLGRGDKIRKKEGHCYVNLYVESVVERGLVVSHGDHAHEHLKEWSELEEKYERI